MLKAFKVKHYFIIILPLIVILGAGIWYLAKNQGQRVVTQTLRIEKVYGKDRGDGYGGIPCYNNNDCSGNDICYYLEPVACNDNSNCINCGTYPYYSCQQLSPYGNVCWGGPNADNLRPCGVCGARPAQPVDSNSCADVLPQNPAYRFSIHNPAGVEKAYFSAEGYLVIIDGILWKDMNQGQVEQLKQNNFYCGHNPAGAYIIENSQGSAVAAIVTCDINDFVEFYVGQVYTFVQNDYTNTAGNDLVIQNGPFNSTASWIDESGNLHLKGCYVENNP